MWLLLGTNQEDGQLKLVIKHHSMNAAGSTEPGCDLIQEVSMEDEKEDSRAWNRRYGQKQMDLFMLQRTLFVISFSN